MCGVLALCVGLSGRDLSALAQHADLSQWARQKREAVRLLGSNGRSGDAKFNEPVYLNGPLQAVGQSSLADRRIIASTTALYGSVVGDNTIASLVWTGLESGNPLTRNEDYRWDSIEDQGLFDPGRRRLFITELKNLGIVNLRVGMSNHRIDIDNEASWKEHDALIEDLSDADINISLDLHHFGIEDRFRMVGADGATVPEVSYYLHQDWPDYFARFAAAAYTRYGARIKAVTLINEPETTVGFNGEMWHGAFPRWANPLHHFYYIERAIQVAKAALKARLAIEAVAAKAARRVLFIHPEAAVFKPYWREFNRFIRFLASDLMVGENWLFEADLEQLGSRAMTDIAGDWKRKPSTKRTSLDWVIQNYVVYSQPLEKREANRARLVRLLGEVRALHEELRRSHGKSMRTDTVFGIDYYAHNEDKAPDGSRLGEQPQLYDRQVSAGRRAGLYPVMIDYFNRYHIPMMITETGTPYYHYGARWHQQMLLECAQAASQGVPFLGYTIYPAIDTWGWETALSVSKERTLLNPGGVLQLDFAARPFARRLLNSLAARMQPRSDPSLQGPQASSSRADDLPVLHIP